MDPLSSWPCDKIAIKWIHMTDRDGPVWFPLNSDMSRCCWNPDSGSGKWRGGGVFGELVWFCVEFLTERYPLFQKFLLSKFWLTCSPPRPKQIKKQKISHFPLTLINSARLRTKLQHSFVCGLCLRREATTGANENKMNANVNAWPSPEETRFQLLVSREWDKGKR